MFPDGTPLRGEYAKALACHERALLYADNADLVDKIVKRQEPPNLPSTSNPNIEELARCAHITFLYQEAAELLLERLDSVSILYASHSSTVEKLEKIRILRNGKLRKSPIKIGDRDQHVTGLSEDFVSSRFKSIIDMLRRRSELMEAHFLSNPSAIFDLRLRKCYERDWEGLNNICRLFMEEINYLRSRIDDFIKISISDAGLRRARLSIYIAVAALCLNLGVNLLKGSKPPEANQTHSDNIDKSDMRELEAVLEKINTNVANIHKDIGSYAENELQLSGSMSTVIVAQLQQMNARLGNIKDSAQTLSQQEQVITNLQSEIKTLDSMVSALTTGTNSRPPLITPADFNRVLDKLDEVKSSVISVADAVKKKEIPAAKVEVHTWGVGVIKSMPRQ